MENTSALRPGTKLEWSRTITEEDVRRFAELSGDHGRHHLERDAQGRLLAHGLLTATLPTKLGGDLHFIARTMTFEFLKPVYAGDSLRCVGAVDSVVTQTKRHKVKLSFVVTSQSGDVVLQGGCSGMILR